MARAGKAWAQRGRFAQSRKSARPGRNPERWSCGSRDAPKRAAFAASMVSRRDAEKNRETQRCAVPLPFTGGGGGGGEGEDSPWGGAGGGGTTPASGPALPVASGSPSFSEEGAGGWLRGAKDRAGSKRCGWLRRAEGPRWRQGTTPLRRGLGQRQAQVSLPLLSRGGGRGLRLHAEPPMPVLPSPWGGGRGWGYEACVWPRPAGGTRAARQTTLHRVGQRAEPGAPVLGRATEGDSGRGGRRKL